MKPKVSEPHPTISGWCCACDVDQMTYRGMLKKALDQQKAEIVEKEKCWPWGGSTDGNGYGQVMVNGKPYRAHRLMYELVHKGEELPPKSSGLTIDHICRNRSCINPNHLEIVTNRENVLRGNGLTAINHRKTHCTKGHPLSGANLYLYQKGNTIERSCRECRRVCRRAWKAKQKEKSKDDIINKLEEK